MKARNLLQDPCWRAKDLGEALPPSPHAVSVALPRWQDVIDYEEKNEKCLQALQSIYPRFGLNPLVSEVAKRASDSNIFRQCFGWPFPNQNVAQKALEHCLKSTNGKAIIKEVLGLSCLITDEKACDPAKAF